MKTKQLIIWLRESSSGGCCPCEEAANIVETALKWKAMSDSEMRLHLGEATSQEIRTARAILGQIIPED